jgi:hypothetical protein
VQFKRAGFLVFDIHPAAHPAVQRANWTVARSTAIADVITAG